MTDESYARIRQRLAELKEQQALRRQADERCGELVEEIARLEREAR